MGGFRVGSVRGISIRIHVSFVLALPLLGFWFARAFRHAAVAAGIPPDTLSGPPIVWGVAMALALFLSVLLHELGYDQELWIGCVRKAAYPSG
jgi:Zn-dependent protease